MAEAVKGVKRKADSNIEDPGGVKRRHGDEDSGIVHDVQVVQFAESRATEIKALEKKIRTFTGTKTVQQRLPRHMRRRAMSHNIKRLPKIQRAWAEKSYANQEGVKKKRPSRFHRRRPKNLLKEYMRRQRKHIWLETHIWHAKRFHMIEKWGHKLPWKPTSKSERAAYRATSHHCLLQRTIRATTRIHGASLHLQDMSYMCCIELRGRQETILEGLGHLTNPQTGPTFASKACIQGTREGNTVLYQYGDYPDHCIGPVSFLWKPQFPVETGSSEVGREGKQLGTTESSERQLWLWCHPSSFDLVWREILNCFNTTSDTKSKQLINKASEKEIEKREVANEAVVAEPTAKGVLIEAKDVKKHGSDKAVHDKVDDSNNLAREGENYIAPTVKEYWNKSVKPPEPKRSIFDKFKSEEEVSVGGITVKSLAGSLLRYRLTGPLSNAILADTLQQANIVPSKNSGNNVKWWHKYYVDPSLSLGHSLQKEFWESVGHCLSPAEMPPHCVLGLTVQDPRLGRPVKRKKIFPSETVQADDRCVSKEKITDCISLSPLWNSSVREEVTSTKMTDFQMNRLKEENLVSGFPLNLGNEESKIPVLLVQNPGVASPVIARGHDPTPGRGSGWDLILPKGWGMPFWLAFVYREARCGGIHELEHGAFEQCSLSFPHDYPDSVAGKKHQLEVEFSSVEKYNRRPPAKRPNFVKLGVASPFYCPWYPLVKYWLEQDSTSEKHGLDQYANFITEEADYFVLRERKILRKLANILEIESLMFVDNKSRRPSHSIDKVNKLEAEVFQDVRFKYRNSLVPVRVDMLQRGTPAFCAQMCIPTLSDLQSLKVDKTYGGPIERLHTDKKKTDFKRAKQESKGKKKVKLKFDKTMKLFSDTERETDVNISDRQVIGYLNSGGFSLGVGNGHGIGFCSTLGLYFLIKSVQRDTGLLVLVRNPMSRQYRFAKLSLI